MAIVAQDFTDETLEHTLEDATCFLSAIAAVPEIRTAFGACELGSAPRVQPLQLRR
jgi:hypothetical protein